MQESYARVRNTLLGNLPTVQTVGIMTAQNPMGQPFTGSRNLELNRQLLQDLHNMTCGNVQHCGALRIQGKFGGNPEDSFVIPNIRRSDIINLANKYKQKSVIWGMKRVMRGEEKYPFFEFEYIEGGKTTQIRSVSVSGPDVQSREDFYSAVKNRKFIIPFFDDPYSDYEPGPLRGTIKPREPIKFPQPEQPHREPDTLPIFDEPPLRRAESFNSWLRRKLLAEELDNR